MDDLLTTRELQDLLKVDRTTVYRMLKDGRLNGIRIGEQWRFSRNEVNCLLAGVPLDRPAQPSSRVPTGVLPIHCIQYIQNVFAEVAGVGALTVAATGEPLSEISNCSRFCHLILASESGRQACINSWGQLAGQPDEQAHFATCHAGLQLTCAGIDIDGQLEGTLIAGQFYAAAPSPAETARIQQLAETYGLDQQSLAEAAAEIPVLDEHKRARMGAWLQSVADSFANIGRERSELMGRLRRIAEMSNLEPV